MAGLSAGAHYAALGVDRGAPADEVRAAWRRAARRLHPDAGGDAAGFQAALRAKEVLLDPAARAAYDRLLAASGPACAACRGAGRTYRQRGPLAREASPCGACRGLGVVPKEGAG